MRITRKMIGQPVTFQGFDGRAYDAVIGCVSHGMAVICYAVTTPHGRSSVTAYVAQADWSRLSARA